MPALPYLDLASNAGLGQVTSGGLTTPAAGTSEAWTVSAVTAFPAVAAGTAFRVSDPTDQREIILVTACPGGTGAGQSWTVTRGYEGTVTAHQAGFTLNEIVTAGLLGKLVQGIPSGTEVPAIAYGSGAAGGLVAALAGAPGTDAAANGFAAGYTGPVQALQPGSSPQAVEAWHNVTPPSGWSGVCRYRKLAELNMACVDFQLSHAGATGNVNVITSLPAAYLPASSHDFPLAILSNTAPPNSNQRCTVNPSGNIVTTFALPASTTGIKALLVYPLD